MLHALGPDVGIGAGNNKNAPQLTNKQVGLGMKEESSHKPSRFHLADLC